MEAFLAYLGYSAIGIAIFYLFFKLLLSKEKSFRLNRAFILASILLPLVLPCIHLEMNFLTESPSGIATWEFLQANSSPAPSPDLKGNTSSEPILIPILSAIYIIGAVLCLFHIGILPCLRLHRLVSKGKNLENFLEKSVAIQNGLCYHILAFIRRGGLLRRHTRNEKEVNTDEGRHPSQVRTDHDQVRLR